jgi:hypothetical protein
MMNRAFVFVCLLLAASPAIGAKVVADVSPGTTHCGWYLDTGTTPTVIVVDAGGATCSYTLSTTLPSGPHTATADARSVDPIWGTVASVKSAPFAFTKPAVSGASAPASLRLVP